MPTVMIGAAAELRNDVNDDFYHIESRMDFG